MKNIIGFTDNTRENETVPMQNETAPAEINEPFACLARIRFPGIEKEYSYYNDAFYLEPGDRVFVSGKLYGTAGVVTNVNRHFRINLKNYKKVIAKINTAIKGRFVPVADKMVSFDSNVTAEVFEQTIIAPPDPDDETDAGEIVSGEGWEVVLEDFENSPDVELITTQRALDYCINGSVAFLSLNGGKGTAFVQGSDWYKVEFEFDGETVRGLFCDCPFPAPSICKHEIAVLFTLRMLLEQPALADEKNFVAFDKSFFLERFFSSDGEIVFH